MINWQEVTLLALLLPMNTACETMPELLFVLVVFVFAVL